MTPLHWAAEKGNIQCIRLLVDAGADMDAPGEYGWVPLHIAARDNQPSAITCLVELGCRLDVTNKSGMVKF